MFRILFISFTLLCISVTSLVVVLVNYILRFVGLKRLVHIYIWPVSQLFANCVLLASGIKISVLGKENIPTERYYCIVSNHQTFIDFVILAHVFPSTIGYIAKKSVKYIPILNIWLSEIGCIFIDRNKREQSIAQIQLHSQKLQHQQCIHIFPEGTRSNGAQINKFKIKGLQTILDVNPILLPCTIVNSYQLNNRFKAARIDVVISKAIDCELINQVEKDNMITTLEHIIAQPLIIA